MFSPLISGAASRCAWSWTAGPQPPPPPGGATPGDEETYDLDDVADIVDAPTVPALPAEERILQAFPGSVLDV